MKRLSSGLSGKPGARDGLSYGTSFKNIGLRCVRNARIRSNACGNAVAAKRFSISNPRERQLAFTALLSGDFMKPQRVGWYWFLPDEHCPTPTGLLRLDKPVVLLVGVDKVTRDMPPQRFVVRFSTGMMFVDDMSGDWEPIEEPERMKQEALKRIIATTSSR